MRDSPLEKLRQRAEVPSRQSVSVSEALKREPPVCVRQDKTEAVPTTICNSIEFGLDRQKSVCYTNVSALV
ncbi:hypothetical protein [Chamaesiphon sp. GL140_3_metabinner_50]|uniref:hypothetical protein n=1 Tax=Chamaesiphon sp. GL140_3_metabinner_50 TaxID=2970812 RepID=UPI0025E38EF6|nr:hypothetical protein [Chamaesiphon sp. GL140_3_metabinner_50]